MFVLVRFAPKATVRRQTAMCRFTGRAEEAESHVLEALRLSPRDTFAYAWMAFVGSAKICLGKDEEAVAWLRRSIERNRNQPGHFFLAAAQALRMSEAQAAAKVGLALNRPSPSAAFRRAQSATIRPTSRNPTASRWHAQGRGAGRVRALVGSVENDPPRT
jgi:tetratricopeptide (TPR) repeat protein